MKVVYFCIILVISSAINGKPAPPLESDEYSEEIEIEEDVVTDSSHKNNGKSQHQSFGKQSKSSGSKQGFSMGDGPGRRNRAGGRQGKGFGIGSGGRRKQGGSIEDQTGRKDLSSTTAASETDIESNTPYPSTESELVEETTSSTNDASSGGAKSGSDSEDKSKNPNLETTEHPPEGVRVPLPQIPKIVTTTPEPDVDETAVLGGAQSVPLAEGSSNENNSEIGQLGPTANGELTAENVEDEEEIGPVAAIKAMVQKILEENGPVAAIGAGVVVLLGATVGMNMKVMSTIKESQGGSGGGGSSGNSSKIKKVRDLVRVLSQKEKRRQAISEIRKILNNSNQNKSNDPKDDSNTQKSVNQENDKVINEEIGEDEEKNRRKETKTRRSRRNVTPPQNSEELTESETERAPPPPPKTTRSGRRGSRASSRRASRRRMRNPYDDDEIIDEYPSDTRKYGYRDREGSTLRRYGPNDTRSYLNDSRFQRYQSPGYYEDDVSSRYDPYRQRNSLNGRRNEDLRRFQSYLNDDIDNLAQVGPRMIVPVNVHEPIQHHHSIVPDVKVLQPNVPNYYQPDSRARSIVPKFDQRPVDYPQIEYDYDPRDSFHVRKPSRPNILTSPVPSVYSGTVPAHFPSQQILASPVPTVHSPSIPQYQTPQQILSSPEPSVHSEIVPAHEPSQQIVSSPMPTVHSPNTPPQQQSHQNSSGNASIPVGSLIDMGTDSSDQRNSTNSKN